MTQASSLEDLAEKIAAIARQARLLSDPRQERLLELLEGAQDEIKNQALKAAVDDPAGEHRKKKLGSRA